MYQISLADVFDWNLIAIRLINPFKHYKMYKFASNHIILLFHELLIVRLIYWIIKITFYTVM